MAHAIGYSTHTQTLYISLYILMYPLCICYISFYICQNHHALIYCFLPRPQSEHQYNCESLHKKGVISIISRVLTSVTLQLLLTCRTDNLPCCVVLLQSCV